LNDLHRTVSSEDEALILVDVDDNVVGHLAKGACHDGTGIMHRAFSLFLFNEAGELLLQQRSRSKRLWPGYWSNSCCSHPRQGESLAVATRRRLLDELNFETELEHVYRFSYEAQFGDAGSENELCHVFLGRTTDAMRPNDSEIEAIRFLSADELDREFARQPGAYTPWFMQEWTELRGKYSDRVDRYCRPA